MYIIFLSLLITVFANRTLLAVILPDDDLVEKVDCSSNTYLYREIRRVFPFYGTFSNYYSYGEFSAYIYQDNYWNTTSYKVDGLRFRAFPRDTYYERVILYPQEETQYCYLNDFPNSTSREYICTDLNKSYSKRTEVMYQFGNITLVHVTWIWK